MEKLTRTERIIELIKLLSDGRSFKSIDHLAQEMNVNERTIQRDLHDIDEIIGEGMPIIEKGDYGGYRLQFDNLMDIFTEMEDEVAISAIKATPFGALLRTREIKMPEPLIDKLKTLIELKGQIHKDHFRYLFNAMRDGSFLEIVYRSKDEDKKHFCVPIKMYFDYSLLYLVVYDKDYGHLIALGASKIKSINKTRDKIPIKELEDYRSYINSAWGKMIRHSDKLTNQAVFVVDQGIITYFHRNPIHGSQKIEDLGDGSYRVEVTIHHPVEFVRWALRFGEHLKIIGDADVLAETGDFLQRMLKWYR